MDTTDDALRSLNELAKLGMDVVRRLHGAVLDAGDDPATLIALTDAYCDAGRGVRQSVALMLRIRSGGFATLRAVPHAADPGPGADEDPPEREDREERPERADWNEYERPDYETPLRLVGDAELDAAAIEAAVAGAVVRIRRSYAKGLALLAPQPEPPPRGRKALLAGAARLGPADSS
ncbi:MAG: hypothetical protein JNL41_16580 [Phenylobacterium sp.]|uniref:hypothetical protein n=1 Tax=Phenylobacterium sp. TaxID=1871053 RepID=UPI001A55AA3B|nr:hypothetical protein [Phenylobacterium sp.]MBL8555894.1 hypothetical protein [Phenylobacterium sp.]